MLWALRLPANRRFVCADFEPGSGRRWYAVDMPLQRISIASGKDFAYRQAVVDGVHRALVEACGVPEDYRFQILTEHAPGSLVCSPKYLGIEHGRAPVFVQITLNRGRTVAQKKALYARIADLLFEGARVPRADVIVSLVEVDKEDWSFGNGLAQYAPDEAGELPKALGSAPSR